MTLENGIGSFYGLEVRTIPEEFTKRTIKKQVKFPRRKNNRICARWRKNKKNFADVKERVAWMIGGKMFADEKTIIAIKTEVPSTQKK